MTTSAHGVIDYIDPYGSKGTPLCCRVMEGHGDRQTVNSDRPEASNCLHHHAHLLKKNYIHIELVYQPDLGILLWCPESIEFT